MCSAGARCDNMLTVTAKSIIDSVFKRSGLDPDDATPADVEALLDYVADRYKAAREYYKWPQFMDTQERLFRPAWDAGETYAEDEEVYFEDDDTYYTCLAATSAGQSPETNPEKWEELTEFRRIVDWEQDGEDAFEVCTGAWDRDPQSDAEALPLPYSVRNDGIQFGPEVDVTSVWLEIRIRPRKLTATIYDEAEAYADGDGVYFPELDGNVYVANQATTAGQTPGTHASKWDLVPIADFLELAVKAGAQADWLTSDERPRAGVVWDEKFENLLEEQVWQLTKLQGQTGAPNVSR